MNKQLQLLEFQPMLSSGLCKSFYAAMVEETTTVEDNFGNSFLQARLGNHFTNLLCYFLKKQIPEQWASIITSLQEIAAKAPYT